MEKYKRFIAILTMIFSADLKHADRDPIPLSFTKASY